MNPLKRLHEFGQSVYLDEISRQLIEGGTLDTLINRDGLHGVTSNPAIFEKAIAQSTDYDDLISQLAASGKGVEELYEALVVGDIQDAADMFRELYDSSGGEYGYVSLEVSPELALDTAATIAEARRLWAAVERPNVFIKVPATVAGLPAITQLIGEGINVNVTLLFSLSRYQAVAEAYLQGLEARLDAGERISGVTSVASFFLSRIDTMIDPLLDEIAEGGGDKAGIARSLRGETAVASAKKAYQTYKELFAAPRFEALRAEGAGPQKLLWASTSTKDPSYSDVKYVEPLIGPETINTMPRETMDAYRDHGRPEERLEEGADQAAEVLDQLGHVGIDLNEIAQRLEAEGVDKFVEPHRSLLKTLAETLEEMPA